MTDWKTVHGDVSPLELDTVSSSYTVYERRNIQTETIEDMDGSTRTGYVYEERTYTRDEWDAMNSPAHKEQMQLLSSIELSVAMLEV